MDNHGWSLKACAAMMLLCAGMSGLTARASEGVDEDCSRSQCLIADFITSRNGAAVSVRHAHSAYGDQVGHLLPQGGASREQLCEAVPSTDCFLRVVALRQKIYRVAGGSDPVGCVVVGGIFGKDKLYRSFGVVYEFADSEWRPVSIHYFMSTNVMPTSSDLLTDPCPTAESASAATPTVSSAHP